MSYAGRSVLVVGMGRSGRAAGALLAREGARVTAYDRNPERLENLGFAATPVSTPEPPDFDAFDAVVASPGIPLPAHPRLVPEIDLAFPHLRAPVVAVTGTNGKSTTTTLIAEMLTRAGLSCTAGGNIGTALCTLVDRDLDWIVAELSSFQIEHARRFAPRVAVLLNLAPDHLDRHGSVEAYAAAKGRLAELVPADGVLVANLDDAWAAAAAATSPREVFPFSALRVLEQGASVAGNSLVVRRGGSTRLEISIDALAPSCRMLIENALAASAAAVVAGAKPDAIAAVLRDFKGLPHRVEHVCTRRGVEYVNDSKATNPAAAVVALRAQRAPVWLLAGGLNKGLDFAPLAHAAAGTRGAFVFGQAAADLAAALAGVTDVVRTETLEQAVREAAARAQPGDVVLLAPACASFDQFTSFEDRGARFAGYARALPC